MFAIRRYEINSDCGTNIDHQTSLLGYLICANHRQPTVQTKAGEVLIAVANAG
ncbi:hypothetical protein D3C77_668000 [compost metagenome]